MEIFNSIIDSIGLMFGIHCQSIIATILVKAERRLLSIVEKMQYVQIISKPPVE